MLRELAVCSGELAPVFRLRVHQRPSFDVVNLQRVVRHLATVAENATRSDTARPRIGGREVSVAALRNEREARGDRSRREKRDHSSSVHGHGRTL